MRGGTRVSRPVSLLVSLLFWALLLSSAAAQAAGGKRIGVPKFEGAQEALVRKEVMKSLKSHGFQVVGSRAMADAISSTGASLDSDDGLQKLAKELSLAAIVTGEVGPKRAKIVVHDGGDPIQQALGSDGLCPRCHRFRSRPKARNPIRFCRRRGGLHPQTVPGGGGHHPGGDPSQAEPDHA